MPYKHISAEQRTELGALLYAKVSKAEIALQLNKHRTSIWRERKRNRSNTKTLYHASQAQRSTTKRRVSANQRFRKLENQKELREYIVAKLKSYWSPEQISGRLKLEFGFAVIVHETIYQYIYKVKPDLKQYLRCKKGKYRLRHGSDMRQKQREEGKKKRIDSRPEIIERRERIGDFEGDTVVGLEKRIKILTHVERKSGLLLADKTVENTAVEVEQKTTKRFMNIPRNKKHTITYDNGSEFSTYEYIQRNTKMDVYFAYPYHAWERGTNENTNGLLRQFFPKKTAFAGITNQHLQRVVSLINNRPRKRHNYKTSLEVFSGCCALD